MNKGDILKLADRVEGLEGADREVDLAIARMRRVTVWKRDPETGTNYETTYWHYTASLSAATSLFPADCFYRSGHDGAGPDVTMFFCDAIASDKRGLPLPGVRAVSLTEPNARTAAALRAIAATMEDGHG